MKTKRRQLRLIAKDKGLEETLSAAQGKKIGDMSDNDVQTIKDLYCEILGMKDLTSVSLEVLMNYLKPEEMFEKFAYRK